MAQFPNAMSNKIELVKYRHLCGYEAEILRFVEAAFFRQAAVEPASWK